MEKIISYSLFGSEEYYRKGVIRNIKLAAKIFPGWKVYIFIEDTKENKKISTLAGSFSNTVIKLMKQRFPGDGVHWRFLPLEWPNTICIIRDIDTSLTIREYQLTEEWLDSEYWFNTIRDEPGHRSPIMAGAFSGIGGHISIADKWTKFYLGNYTASQIETLKNEKSIFQSRNDLVFLGKMVYPIIRKNLLVFTRFSIFDGDAEVRITPKVTEKNHAGLYKVVGMREFSDITTSDFGRELIENNNEIRISESSPAASEWFNKRYDQGALKLYRPRYKYKSLIKNTIWWMFISTFDLGIKDRMQVAFYKVRKLIKLVW